MINFIIIILIISTFELNILIRNKSQKEIVIFVLLVAFAFLARYLMYEYEYDRHLSDIAFEIFNIKN